MKDKLEGPATLIISSGKGGAKPSRNASPHRKGGRHKIQKINVSFKNGQMNDVDNGFVQHRLKDGSGYVINYPNGVLYKGEVVESMRHGYGTLYAPKYKNMRQKIDFEDPDLDLDQFISLAKYKIYEGEFRFNQYHGMGMEYQANGKLRFKGQFKHGEKHGYGTMYKPSHLVTVDENGNEKDISYQGDFVHGKPIEALTKRRHINASPEKNDSIPEHNADPKTSQFSFGGFEP